MTTLWGDQHPVSHPLTIQESAVISASNDSNSQHCIQLMFVCITIDFVWLL